MGPPEELVASFRWAKCCVDYLDQQGELGWLKSMETLPISTWFSGYGCAETAFQMLESALKGKRETDGKSFSSSYQFEIAVKARQACLDRIDAHTCQHIDILRRLRDVDRIELEKIEQASSNPSEDLWEFLLKKQFLSEGLCSRHKNRCSFPLTIMDVTGSMCLGYSTLGKKDDGKLLKENSPHNKLMLIWAIHHGRKQTPALIHENVRGFSSSYLSAKLGHFGYRFLTSIQTTGENCAMKANSRQRLNLSQYDVFILEKYFNQIRDPAEVYQRLVERLTSVMRPVELQHVAWMNGPEWEKDLRQEMVENRNQNSVMSAEEAKTMEMTDWTGLLSSNEQANYTKYLEHLGQLDQPKELRQIRAVCVSQDPEYMFMAGSEDKLPSFTTDSTRRIMLTHLNRWLSAKEKMSLAGFPVHKDMAAAAGVGLVELDNTSQWHRGCGNGMIVGNVGMVVLSVLSSISPKEDLQAALSQAISDQDMLGVPEQLKFHGGWKKWRLEVGQSTHSFAANDKAAAVAAAMWAKSCLAHLDCLPSKALLAETKESGMAAKRNKSSQIEAVLHLRYRAQKFACICCAGPKVKPEVIGPPADHAEEKKEKHVVLPLSAVYYTEIVSGRKCWEFRLSPEGIKAVCECKHEQWQVPHEHSIGNEEAVEDVPYYIHYSGKRSRLLLFDENMVPEIETAVKASATARASKRESDSAGQNSQSAETGDSAPRLPQRPHGIQTVQETLAAIKQLKDWLLESMDLCFQEPEKASKEFRTKALELASANPGLSDLLTECGVSAEEGSTACLNFSQLASFLRRAEGEQDQIQQDLLTAGPARRPRGRPFGSTNKKTEADGEDASKKTRRKKTPKGKATGRKEPEAEDEGIQRADEEKEGETGFPETDPFGDLEQETSSKRNKCVTIPLYVKCLVVECAKKLEKDESVQSIEKEVMVRFKKYFYSCETNGWKSSLLSKWIKTYDAESHEKIPWSLMTVKDRAQIKQLPDWLRRAMSLPARCRHGHASRVPQEVEERNLEPEKMRVKDIDNRWVYRFLYKWQWSFLTSNTKGQFLPDESTEMNEMRRAHRSQRVIEGVPWQMVLNFDQLWRSSFEAPSKVLHKRSAKQATREGDQFMEVRPDDLIGKRLQAVLKLAENEMTSRMGQAPKASKLRKAAARSEFVVGGRVGVTAVTATKLANLWIDQALGYRDPGLEQASRPIHLGLNGQKHLSVGVEENVKALIYSWQEMANYKRLLRWSWTSRGLVTPDEMKELHPKLNEEEKNELGETSPSPFKQMVQDPQNDSNWLSLPILMQQHADKNYAQYQGDVYAAKKRLEIHEITQRKYDTIVGNSLRPLVLMNGTGVPATQKYVKAHLQKCSDGTMKLKDGARSTIILFDFLEKKVKIGGLDWSPLRVLEVETKFDGLELKVDKSFLESVRVPGKVKTNKQTNIFDSPVEEEEKANAEQNYMEELAANGMLIPVVETLSDAMSDMVQELFAGDEQKDTDSQELYSPSIGHHDDQHMNGGEDLEGAGDMTVKIDEAGNLIAVSHDIELVEEGVQACTSSQPTGTLVTQTNLIGQNFANYVTYIYI
ncbi:unnamed protein product [Durusdinium trenchii]|uniref:Uncharacterized protein n=1 Tax=Durusdinium trenchii TaxID=1381693 RepID=A0ABP0QFL0_9DINO